MEQPLLFLIKLAWACRYRLPILITVGFMALDIRMQLEIHVQMRRIRRGPALPFRGGGGGGGGQQNDGQDASRNRNNTDDSSTSWLTISDDDEDDDDDEETIDDDMEYSDDDVPSTSVKGVGADTEVQRVNVEN